MKFLFTLLLLACAACAVNTIEQEFLCPICGTHWKQRIETSGHANGLRLDLRQLGDVVDPATLPQCTKCRFPLFNERISAQANDPEKAPAFKRLRSFVTSADFQMLAAKNPSYFALAQVQEFLGAPHRVIALSYLRASWQAEDRPAVCQRLLEKARAYCIAALKDLPSAERRAGDLALVCGEIERRLGKWDDAEKRFRVMENAGLLKGTRQAGIPALQLRLIAKQDSAPHLLDDADTARSQLPEILAPLGAEQPLRLENPGPAAKPDDALKLAPPPKAPSPFQDPLAPAGK